MLPLIVNVFRILVAQYYSSIEVPGQGSEVRRLATPSSRVSPVSDGTDSSIQHKKIVAMDIQGAGKESLLLTRGA